VDQIALFYMRPDTLASTYGSLLKPGECEASRVGGSLRTDKNMVEVLAIVTCQFLEGQAPTATEMASAMSSYSDATYVALVQGVAATAGETMARATGVTRTIPFGVTLPSP